MKMKKVIAIGGLAAAGGGTALLVGRLSGSKWARRVVGNNYRSIGPARGLSGAYGRASSDGQTERWHAITVNRSPEEVAPEGQLPGPLADLGEEIAVRVQPAPGDRGTEIHTRLRATVASGVGGVRARIQGEDPRQALRNALRETQ
jgi:hypothetical protein